MKMTRIGWMLFFVAGCGGGTSSTTTSDAASSEGDGNVTGVGDHPPTDGPSGTGGDAPLEVVAGPGGLLKVRILDTDGKPTAARVNVIGSDHAYYEPSETGNALAAFSLRHLGDRQNLGPVRYHGAYFYTDGTFEVRLPPGPARLEVGRGYAYYISTIEAAVVAERRTFLDVTLRPLVDMPAAGWYATDQHMHFERPNVDDLTLVKAISAEGLQFAQSLAVYPDLGTGTVFAQKGGYGAKTIRTWNGTSLVSGNEHRSDYLGHVTQLMITDLPAATKQSVDQFATPLATVYDQTSALGGAMSHAHGGGGYMVGELSFDVVMGKSDWLEVVQFGTFRGLDQYYQLLNVGYRYPLAGGSDFSYCRTLADSMTYVMDKPNPTFETIIGGMVRGEAFATSGPLLFLSVDGKGPGTRIEAAGSQKLTVKVKAVSASSPFNQVELVVNGQVTSFKLPGSVLSWEETTSVTVTESSWIAARCQGPQDVRAHTNPVWVDVNGETRFDPQTATAVAAGMDQVLTSDFGTTRLGPGVVDFMNQAKGEFDKLVVAGKNPKGPVRGYPRNSTIVPGSRGSNVLPATLDRPSPLPAVTIEGTVLDTSGAPLAAATVRARGAGTGAQTDSKGHFSLAGLVSAEPLFLRVTKTGYVATNTSYINHRCSGACVKIVSLTTTEGDALMKGREPAATPDALKKLAWVAVNLIDGAGKLKAGVSAPIVTPNTFGGGAPNTVLKFIAADGKFSGSSTVANPKGGIQAIASVPILYPESADPATLREPGLIVTSSTFGKSLVLPVVPGEFSYGVLVEGLAGAN